MKLTVRYSFISKAYSIICIIALILYMLIDMSGQEHGSTPIPGAGVLICIITLTCYLSAVKLLVIPDLKLYSPNITIWCYLAFLTWAFYVTLTNDIPGNALDKIAFTIKQAIPLCALLIPFNFIMNYGYRKSMKWIFACAAVLFALNYFYIMMQIFLSGEAPHMLISYYVLYTLPLILLTGGKKMRIFFIIFTALILSTSSKRAGVISMTGGLLAYWLVDNLFMGKFKLSSLLGGVFLAAILAGGFFYIASSDETTILERFENIQEDGGSERDVLWIDVINKISNSDLPDLVAGHGYNTVARDSYYGRSAHNDFLEVTYDYGLIGLTLYIIAFLALIKDTILHIIRKTRYAPMLAFTMTVYFFLSMVSHIIIYPWANLLFMMLAILNARCNLEENELTENKVCNPLQE